MQASRKRETRRFCLPFRDAPTGRRVAPPDDRLRTQARNPSGRRLKLWREVKAKNPKSGRRMSDAIFIANKASGHLAIGDRKEMDKATWRKPRGIRLTPTSPYIRDKLFPKRG
jgi:8-oxo-dGTP diphosphatase